MKRLLSVFLVCLCFNGVIYSQETSKQETKNSTSAEAPIEIKPEIENQDSVIENETKEKQVPSKKERWKPGFTAYGGMDWGMKFFSSNDTSSVFLNFIISAGPLYRFTEHFAVGA